MKNLILILFLSICSKIYSQTSSSATVHARALVVEPIRITKSVDLNFGNVIGGYSSGSLILTPEGTRIANGVLISSSSPGEVSPAEAIIAHGNNNYTITMPESFDLINENSPNQIMVVDDFTIAPQEGTALRGSDVIRIGATLNLRANQLPGFYTNANGFNITVSYN